MKITEEGKKKVQKNIEKMMEDMRLLREEKLRAYSLTGDTWHDNPYFNKLEQDERALTQKIKEAQGILEEAELVEEDGHRMEQVDIGSIIKCMCVYPDFEELEIYEIVGEGESDIASGKIHYQSLVAQNIMGLKVNEEVSFKTPAGLTKYQIVKFYHSWEEARADEE